MTIRSGGFTLSTFWRKSKCKEEVWNLKNKVDCFMKHNFLLFLENNLPYTIWIIWLTIRSGKFSYQHFNRSSNYFSSDDNFFFTFEVRLQRSNINQYSGSRLMGSLWDRDKLIPITKMIIISKWASKNITM